MKTNEFFYKIANTPLKDRIIILTVNEPDLTLQEIYNRVKKLEDKMRPNRIERDRLIRIAEDSNLLK